MQDDDVGAAINSAGADSPDLEMVRKPEVIHVVPHLDFGGVESHMAAISTQHLTARYHHSFLALGEGGRTEERIRSNGADVECLGQSVQIPSWKALISLSRILKRRKPKVVHTHGGEANFHGLVAAAMARIPAKVGEEIGLPRHGLLATAGFKMAYRNACRVIGVSEQVTRYLIESREVPAGKALTMHIPVEIVTVPKGVGPEASGFRCGFVGRLDEVKNLENLIEAFALLVKAGADSELWLIGEGPQRETLQAKARSAGVADRVHMPGYQANPSVWVREWDVCVQPSNSEGFGLAMIEAMGCGVPVITTPVGVASEVIQNNVSGWITTGFDVDSIARALIDAWQLTRQQRRAVGLAAHEAVIARFSPSAYMTTLENFYDELLGFATP